MVGGGSLGLLDFLLLLVLVCFLAAELLDFAAANNPPAAAAVLPVRDEEFPEEDMALLEAAGRLLLDLELDFPDFPPMDLAWDFPAMDLLREDSFTMGASLTCSMSGEEFVGVSAAS